MLCISIAFSQKQISIRSASDSSTLSFATVFDVANKAVGSANEAGVFKISAKDYNSFRISYIGYEDLEIIPNAHKEFDTIYLTRKISTLKELVIKPCRLDAEEKISNLTDNNQALFGGVMSPKANNNGKVAVLIIPKKSPAKLLSLSFWLKRGLPFIPKYAEKSPFAISFYSYSETTKLPGDLLYEKPVFYFPKKEGKQFLKLDTLNINLPLEGMYVCFEFIQDEKYQWNLRSNDSIVVNQGVSLDGTYSEGFGLAFFDYKTNSWIKHLTFARTRPDNTHGTIKIEASYRYCVE